jgi:glucose/mannose-6-phosphate isomerase
MFAALVKVLQNHELLDEELLGSILALEKNLSVEKIENQGKKLAKKFFKKIPIIYTSSRFQEIGWIWKNSLNETAKIIAFCNFFPELNHNETVGFEEINRDQVSNKKISVVILRDQESSHPRILKQMEITKGLIEKEGVAVEFVEIEGNDILEKIFSSAVLGLWTAYWLAIEYGVDPTEIKTIEEFKKRLKEE